MLRRDFLKLALATFSPSFARLFRKPITQPPDADGAIGNSANTARVDFFSEDPFLEGFTFSGSEVRGTTIWDIYTKPIPSVHKLWVWYDTGFRYDTGLCRIRTRSPVELEMVYEVRRDCPNGQWTRLTTRPLPWQLIMGDVISDNVEVWKTDNDPHGYVFLDESNPVVTLDSKSPAIAFFTPWTLEKEFVA